MGVYAKQTTVPVERSQTEIKRTLGRFGARSFGFAEQHDKAAIMFEANGKKVRFILPLPHLDEFQRTEKGRARRGENARMKAYEFETKRRWRALALVIKAKLEAVQTGIAVFEQEFMAHIVLPNGKTVGEVVLPGIEEAYLTGEVKPMMLEFTGSK